LGERHAGCQRTNQKTASVEIIGHGSESAMGSHMYMLNTAVGLPELSEEDHIMHRTATLEEC
jgi:hypothetical protein